MLHGERACALLERIAVRGEARNPDPLPLRLLGSGTAGFRGSPSTLWGMAMGLCVAGREVTDPVSIWRDYARRYPRTISEYDLGPAGEPDTLTLGEVLRMRVLNSTISDGEAEELADRAAELRCPWGDVPPGEGLIRADPDIPHGLFDKAARLYWHFTSDRISRVRITKVHKALHVKRPDMYPILDDRLRKLYSDRATLWVGKLARLHVTIDDSAPYWAAIRQDLVGNEAELDDYRCQLAADPDETIQQMAGLSKLRLLDIVAWMTC